jgi:cupin fold WbuC family metalloprotein
MTIKHFSTGLLSELNEDAKKSPRARQHRNIHSSYEDPCQRLLNAIGMDSYIRPHRHASDPKTETLIAVKGLFALVTFEEDGAIREIVRLGTERYAGDGRVDVGVELSPGTWHTIVALEADAVLLELKAGPFNPGAAKEVALWAPDEGTAEGRRYFEKLRALAHGLSSRPTPGPASSGR